MKIAIDARILSLSTGRYVRQLLEKLQEVDKKNEYLVLLKRSDINKWDSKSDNFSKVVSDYSIYSISEQLAFCIQLYKLNVDLVHFTMPQHPIFYLRKFVVTIHDLTLLTHKPLRSSNPLSELYSNFVKPAVFRLVLSSAIKKSDLIITPSLYVKNEIIKRFGTYSKKVTVTYEAADRLGVIGEPFENLVQEKYILAVGNAYPHKNLKKLVRAMDTDSLKMKTLVISGKEDSFYKQLRDYANRKRITNVVFTGYVSDGQLEWLYQNASLYVFPSLSEGFGLPGLEAMSYGTPVASSNATCLPEVYGDAAVYFDPTSVEDMARVISETLSDKELLAKLRKAGPEHAKKFSWKKMAEETLEVYQKALKR